MSNTAESRPEQTTLPWAAIKPLFEAALSQPDGQREAYVLSNVSDEAMRAELLTLLKHLEISTVVDEPGTTAQPPSPAKIQLMSQARAGKRLGDWEILRRLSVGGLGEVYVVRDAVGRHKGPAALKLLRRRMDSSHAILQRFAEEREALARLRNPHIAALLDAGLSADGQLFFVSAHVEGKPINEAAQGLPVEDRIELFLRLCDVLAHAHRQHLVHRDLKPGNVLVTPEQHVMLLDFGIAKALGPVAARTPHFASPEQVRGEKLSAASDIYSLGVLLHLLLTGLRPTGRDAATAAEAASSVLEETPARPSSLPEMTREPRWRQTRRRLSGDLDKIMLKTLEKSIERRYASVESLAQDLRRYLDGFPVTAHSPSVGYVMGKFIKRHRSGIALASLAALALLLGVVLGS